MSKSVFCILFQLLQQIVVDIDGLRYVNVKQELMSNHKFTWDYKGRMAKAKKALGNAYQ